MITMKLILDILLGILIIWIVIDLVTFFLGMIPNFNIKAKWDFSYKNNSHNIVSGNNGGKDEV